MPWDSLVVLAEFLYKRIVPIHEGEQRRAGLPVVHDLAAILACSFLIPKKELPQFDVLLQFIRNRHDTFCVLSISRNLCDAFACVINVAISFSAAHNLMEIRFNLTFLK